MNDPWREGNELASLSRMTYLNDGGLVEPRALLRARSSRERRSPPLFSWLVGLLAVGGVCFAAPAQAQGEIQAKSEIQGAWATHVFPLGAKPPPQVFLARGSERIPLFVDGQQGRLRTRRYLAPGLYGLVLGSKTLPVRVGDPSQATSAALRIDAWYAGAHDTFRELSATLERRGRFHFALREAKRNAFLGGFSRSFLGESWGPALMSARMDLAMFRRRMLLPPRPKALAALEALAQVLAKRRAAWEACLHPTKPGPAPGASALVEAQAKLLWTALERKGNLGDWSEGPLGTPAPVAELGKTFQDPIGFSLAVPAEAKLVDRQDPVDRLMFDFGGTLVLVRVLEYPGVTKISELKERLARDAFESWTSYKEQSLTEEPGGLRIEFSARLAFNSNRAGDRGNARVLQWARLPEGGQRAFLLIALRPEGRALPPEVLELFKPEVFAVKGAK